MQSMTAFAAETVETELGRLSCEIKSVNQRFLDITIKCPDFLRTAEHELRKTIETNLARGKVLVFINFYPNDQVALTEMKVNHALLSQLQSCVADINDTLGTTESLQLPHFMRWPDVIIQEPADTSQLQTAALALINQTITALLASRKREGAAMQAVLADKLKQLKKITADIRTFVPAINQQLVDKMKARLADLDIEAQPERFEQELAIQLQKVDIAEELDRLDAHVAEFERMLTLSEPSGRRMDFLMQELNREANTIGSKSAAMTTSNASIDLKVVIEQMREQIQNIE
ncbi:MAG: YicC family protein [Proteobacteria bacterium]|nr:MAG: YicC family protein [Pseudomonadota bacterium]